MKIETTIKYYESYIPPRCRKPRYNEITEVVTHNLLETTTENVELASNQIKYNALLDSINYEFNMLKAAMVTS